MAQPGPPALKDVCGPPSRSRGWHILVQWGVLYGFWLVLSGRTDLFHLALGALSASLSVVPTHDLLYAVVTRDTDRSHSKWLTLMSWYRLPRYLVWLLWNLVQANFQVAYVVLHPRLPIDPVLVRFHSRLQSDISRVLLANSITLTPGTVTVDLDEEWFLVHALEGGFAESLMVGNMQRRVAGIFREEEHAQPEVVLGRQIEEMW